MATKYLNIGEKTLAYLEFGSGPSVVIVHGVGGHKEDWVGVAHRLAPTHQVFVIDMLGFGESSKSGDDLSMPIQAQAIAAFLDAHGIEKASLVGNSVGGWVTATFAATYPLRTQRLVLIDVAGFQAMFESEPPVNFDPNTVDEMQTLISFVINSEVARTPGLAEKAFAAYVTSGEKAISPIWGKSLFQSPRLEKLLAQIASPTLILWGDGDRLFPPVLAEVFAAQTPGAIHALIPGAGHFPQIDNPQATELAILEFLTK